MQAYAALRERLDRGERIVLDGPMGSELVRRGVRWADNGMRSGTEAVEALHREYLDAGADVLRTNTFQLNRRVYQNVFRDAAHMRHIGAPDLAQRVPRFIVLICRIRSSSASSLACRSTCEVSTTSSGVIA